MSEDAIKEKIEIYQATFKNLYEQAVADIQKLTGTQGQAAQTATEDLNNKVHRALFGHGHDQEGKEIP
jgi:hypothetical protein